MAEFRLSNFTSGAVLTAAELNTGLTYATYTPVWTQSSIITHTLNTARYTQFGKLVIAEVQLTSTTAGTGGNKITISLPVNASSNNTVLGSGHAPSGPRFALYDTSTTMTIGVNQTNIANALVNLTSEIQNGVTVIFKLNYEAA
jgi:hypothetical protein